ncbi:MAG: AMP-binding protein [Acidimicrobiales bacterium]
MTEPTFAELIEARRSDAHLGLLFESERITWDDVVQRGARRAALALAWRRPGPFHIGVLLDNVPEYVYWIVGCALAGAALVGINPTRRGRELGRDVQHSDCQLLVTDGSHVALLAGLDTGVAPERVLLVDSPEYSAVLGSLSEEHGVADVRPEDRLLLLFTSGSTAAPKAVVCSQGRLARIAGRVPALYGITRDTVTYNAMPLFHGNAIMANWAPALAVGATVAMRRRFSASGFLPDVRRFGATYFNYVGRALAYVLATEEMPDDHDNPLQVGFGTEASARDRELFSSRFGCRLVESYGASEGAIAIGAVPGTPPGALGRALNGEDVAIADPESCEMCPPARFDEHGALVNGDEAIGEIVGRNVADRFEGYYNNPEADAERLRQGWYWSGDLGYADDEGWIYFAGRSTDRLRVDGENFAAAPVEAVLQGLPDLVMVAVYPVPDVHSGDQVMAAVEMAHGRSFDPGSFSRFLAASPDLGTKWAPRFVRVVKQMPLTATNKVSKQPLRAESWDTADPLYWRPGAELSYVALDEEARRELRRQAAEHGGTPGGAVP